MSALYVFALTNESAPPLRLGNRRVEFIEVNGIHAAVERLADPPAISEAALRVQHDIVMKIAESVDAIVPARFGALLDRQELETLVSMRIGPIRETLQHVAGRVQLTVRVFASDGRAEPRQGLTVILREPGARTKRQSGTTYLEERRREAATALTGEAAAVSRAVRELVHEERAHRGHGRIGWTLYHLVNRNVVPEYKRALQPFQSSAVVVSGPWPPFAFVPDLWP